MQLTVQSEFEVDLESDLVFDFVADSTKLKSWILGSKHLSTGDLLPPRLNETLELEVQVLGAEWQITARVTQLERPKVFEIELDSDLIHMLFKLELFAIRSRKTRVTLCYQVINAPTWSFKQGGSAMFRYLIAKPQARKLENALKTLTAR